MNSKKEKVNLNTLLLNNCQNLCVKSIKELIKVKKYKYLFKKLENIGLENFDFIDNKLAYKIVKIN